MMTKKYKLRVIVTACSFALASMSGIAVAQTATNQTAITSETPVANERATTKEMVNQGAANRAADSGERRADAKGATEQITESAKIVREMERDPKLMQVLQQAQGIFIIPEYERASAGVGGRGGEGVVVVKQGGQWTHPAFHNYGDMSLGAQGGAEAVPIAMILISQKALDKFKQEDNWSLNAETGLKVLAWSDEAKGSTGKGDIILWSNDPGLLDGMVVSATDIGFDEEQTAALYGKQVAQQDVFGGNVQAPPQVAELKQALPGSAGATSSGASGTTSEMTSGASAEAGAAASGSSGASAVVVDPKYAQPEAVTPRVEVPADAAAPDVVVTPKLVVPEVIIPGAQSSGANVTVKEPEVVTPRVEVPAAKAAPEVIVTPKAIVPEVSVSEGASSGGNVTVTEPEVVRPRVTAERATETEVVVTPKVIAPEVVVPDAKTQGSTGASSSSGAASGATGGASK
jgi:lipid-binding SYLF domain-containing protein